MNKDTVLHLRDKAFSGHIEFSFENFINALRLQLKKEKADPITEKVFAKYGIDKDFDLEAFNKEH
jgi:hypothetical protein